LKEEVKRFLKEEGYEIVDMGPETTESVDYPDFGEKIAESISKKTYEKGILVCGTGIGMSIVVNKFPRVRGALCSDVFSAKLSREHNDANILILGGRMIGKGVANEMVRIWLNTGFEGGRHQKRLDKISNIEQKLMKGTE